MIKRIAIIAGTALASLCALGQRIPQINFYNGDPTGIACPSPNALVQSTTTGGIYACHGGVYVAGQGPAGPPGPPGTGNITASPQFSLFYQPNSGSQSVAQGDSNITTDGSGNMKAKTSNTSANTVLYVKAPPYSAKCDGSTDDQTAIQAAFTDAAVGSSNANCTLNGCSVQFPAGTCVTSHIIWKGQPFFGAGITASIIQGKPGQDVFATPDGTSWTNPAAGTLVHDIRIVVDQSVDASGASQGNSTFPNRIAGTLGGGTAVSPAIAPGAEAFGTSVSCSGTINGGSLNTIVFSGSFCPTADTLNTIDSWRVVGAPITVHTVGPAGGDLVTTIASVTGPNTLILTTPASSSGSNLSGTFLSPVTPPYYIGNCGFAFPYSNGSTTLPNIQNFQFQNVQVLALYAGIHKANHACGIFAQAPPYAIRLDKVQIQGFWGGYIEAKPATNPGGHTWTGDTSSFKDVDLQNNMLPFIIMAGNHRNFSGINVYGGSQHQTMGPMWLEHGASGTITHMYYECQTTNTGETSRYTGDFGLNIAGGSLNQCNGANSYALWLASRSTVSAQTPSFQIGTGASYNNLTLNGLQAPNFADNGTGNVVTSNGGTNPATVSRIAYVNRPRAPVGMLDGSYLLSGSLGAPYLNASDLVTSCLDMGVLFNQPTIGSCVLDPSGTELTQKYFLSAGATTIVDGTNNGGVANIWANYPHVFGVHVPQSRVNVFIRGECVGASSCTAVLLVKDGTSNATLCTSGTLTFGATWTTQSIINCDLTGTTAGDQLDYRIQSVSNAGTNYAIASIDMQPIPADFIFSGTTVGAIGGSPLAAGACATGTSTGVNGVVAGLTGNAAPVDGTLMNGYVITAQGTATGTATVSVCAIVAGTPVSKNYNWRLFP